MALDEPFQALAPSLKGFPKLTALWARVLGGRETAQAPSPTR